MKAAAEKKFTDGTGFEFYCSDRFFTVTGNQLVGTPGSINTFDCQALADRYARGDIGPVEDCFEQIRTKGNIAVSPKAIGDAHFDVAGFLRRHAIPVLRASFDR